jgi:hypothetical protein
VIVERGLIKVWNGLLKMDLEKGVDEAYKALWRVRIFEFGLRALAASATKLCWGSPEPGTTAVDPLSSASLEISRSSILRRH